MILTVTANPAVDVAYFVESFNMGEVHRPLKTVTTAGGKGLNVARVVSTLGEDVVAMGFIGGANGAFIESETERLGIGNAFTKIKGETRRNIDIIDAKGSCGEMLEQGPEISPEEKAAFLCQYAENVKKCDFICASGSLPRGIDGDFYRELIRIARESNKKILVDTSGSALESVIEEKPFMIKPNKDELSRLAGCYIHSDDSIGNALKLLYAKGVELPFVTLGGDGGALYDGRALYKFIIPKIKIKNTVGSGDSTVAGFAVGLCRGMALCDAVRLGMAAGMSNAESEQSGAVSKEAVDRFYQEIKILKAVEE